MVSRRLAARSRPPGPLAGHCRVNAGRQIEVVRIVATVHAEFGAVGALVAGELSEDQLEWARAVGDRLLELERLPSFILDTVGTGPFRLEWREGDLSASTEESRLRSLIAKLDASGDGQPTFDRSGYERALTDYLRKASAGG